MQITLWRLPPSPTWPPAASRSRHAPLPCLPRSSYYFYYYYTLFLPRGMVRLQTSYSRGCQNPTPCWTRRIQARPNQPWARCSVFIPPPASRGQVICFLDLIVLCSGNRQLQNGSFPVASKKRSRRSKKLLLNGHDTPLRVKLSRSK